tara:strand:+ start:1019 stop:2146 length:1128 start_codon:yes stop_codon:yes gene_type:complete
METIYLDHAATTPPDPEICAQMGQLLTDLYANPSSPHGPGRSAKKTLEESRAQVAGLLGAKAQDLIFTGGGTESLNLAIMGSIGQTPGRIAISAVEHSAIFAAARFLKERLDWQIDVIPVDELGRVTTDNFSKCIHEDTRIVAVMMANNEVGTINDIAALSTILKSKAPRARFVVDAVQAFTKVPFSVTHLGADYVAITAHKLHGLKGIGALWCGRQLHPTFEGGAQEGGVRGGTMCAALAWSFASACVKQVEGMNHIRKLRDQAWAGLQAQIPDLKLIGADFDDGRLENNLNFLVPGLPGEPVVNGLAAKGICVSAGSACAKGKFSRVLTAMGYTDQDGAFIRFSPGRFNTKEEIDLAVQVFSDVISELREMYD